MKNRILNLIAAGVARLLDCRDFRYRVLKYMEKKEAMAFKLSLIELNDMEDLYSSVALNYTEKEIKKAFIDLDLSQADIARRLDVTRAAVNMVIHGRMKSDRIMKYLKRLIHTHKKAA